MNNNNLQNNISMQEKLVKYLVMGIVVFTSLYYIPEIKLNIQENIMISIISAMTFAIFDMISPTIKILISPHEKDVIIENNYN